jgi:hypothetical protein
VRWGAGGQSGVCAWGSFPAATDGGDTHVQAHTNTHAHTCNGRVGERASAPLLRWGTLLLLRGTLGASAARRIVAAVRRSLCVGV